MDQDLIKRCLANAIEKFNCYERHSLLCPSKDENGNYVNRESTAWGAASERAITHRLAVYLECEFRREQIIADQTAIVVDCEYNRHLQRKKLLEISREYTELLKLVKKARKTALKTDDDGYFIFSVMPDVVVHKRDCDENILIVEVKKKSNLVPELRDYDHLKLKCFTNPIERNGYGYIVGAAVTVKDYVDLPERCLCIQDNDWFPQ